MQANKKNLVYSMDAMIPGVYFWFGLITIKFGGVNADKSYPGKIKSFMGFSVVLSQNIIYSTYNGMYE